MENNGVVRLFNQVYPYVVMRKEIEKVNENNGLRYNIFEVLKLSSSEVRLHSSIIASLLSSEKHGAKSEFLKAFLKIPKLGLVDMPFDVTKVRIEVEKYIGAQTNTEGGRIDIYLTDGKKSIILENKIYASDQDNQLLRYHNFKPDGILIYLTLFGDKPSPDSLGNLNENDIICLSYKDDIIPWLERCSQLSARLPYVRETINQYINTLQHLTNSYMSSNNDIIKTIEANIDAAFAIRDNLDNVVNNALCSFLAELKKEVANKTKFKCITGSTSGWINQTSGGFQFEHPDWKGVLFATEFEKTYLGQMGIGLLRKAGSGDIRENNDAIVLAKRLGLDARKNSLWIWGYPNEPFIYNWYNAESIQMIMDGRMVEWFLSKLIYVEEQSKGLNL